MLNKTTLKVNVAVMTLFNGELSSNLRLRKVQIFICLNNFYQFIFFRMKSIYIKGAGIVSLFFGLVTIFMGGSVILDLFGLRAEQGHYVLFVVWANLICGFLYVFSTFGFFARKKWTELLYLIAIWLLVVTFVGFFSWIISGRVYEARTIGAMSFRLVLTLILFIFSRRMIFGERVVE